MLDQPKTGKEFRPNQKKIQLHLGCGRRYIPGFVHIDLDGFPHIDYQHDISCLPMFANNSVDLIYCCHALEYYDRAEVLDVLKEWHRVLRKGGVLRLAVPDFEAIVGIYLKYKDLAHQGILGPLFGKMAIKTPEGEKFFYHKTTYDYKSLKEILESIGFINIQRYNWQETIHKDYDDCSQAYIPHMEKENGTLISLNVEAIKS